MNRRLVPFFKEDYPDIADMRVLHYQVLLRPEKVAAILQSFQRHVYLLCEDGAPQQVKVGKLVSTSSSSIL
jgi:hypothetical protein